MLLRSERVVMYEFKAQLLLVRMLNLALGRKPVLKVTWTIFDQDYDTSEDEEPGGRISLGLSQSRTQRAVQSWKC